MLDHKHIGPFKVIAYHDNAYQLELPWTMKIHNVINVKLLSKVADDPMPGQANGNPGPIIINDDKQWEVEDILDSRRRGRAMKLKYRAKWTDWDDVLEWYPAEDFEGAQELVDDFHAKHPDRPGLENRQ